VLKFCSFLVLSSNAGIANPHHFRAAALHVDSNPDPDVVGEVEVFTCRYRT
jgi:hypothetical protein